MVPLTGEITLEHLRNAVISIGGTVPATGITWEILREQSDFQFFVPANLDGATSKSQITKIDQWRGYPRQRWGNTVRAQSFTKACAGDGVGTSHTYTVVANSYYSFVSQADANAQADANITANGQTWANGQGYCTWSSDALEGTFYKNNCADSGEGSGRTHSAAAGYKTSTISKADANAQAHAAWSTIGQNAANSEGYCTWYSDARSASIQRDNCGANGTGSYVSVSRVAGAHSSTTSKSNANSQRDAAMQSEANSNGSCTYIYYSTERGENISRNNCGGGAEGTSVYVYKAAGAHTSSESVAHANALRDAAMQSEANTNGSCVYYSDARSASIQRNDCGESGVGTYVSVSRTAGAHSSTVSKSLANSIRDINMQEEANANGSCTVLSLPTPSYSYSSQNGATGSDVTWILLNNLPSGATAHIEILDGEGVSLVQDHTTPTYYSGTLRCQFTNPHTLSGWLSFFAVFMSSGGWASFRVWYTKAGLSDSPDATGLFTIGAGC